MAVKLETSKLDKIVREVLEQSRNRYIVHDGVEYGVYVELGTEKMPSRPALLPAFEKYTSRLPEMLKQAMKGGDIAIDRTLRLVCANIVKEWKANAAKPSFAKGKFRPTGEFAASIDFTVERK